MSRPDRLGNVKRENENELQIFDLCVFATIFVLKDNHVLKFCSVIAQVS